MKTIARFFRWLADKMDPPVSTDGGGGPPPVTPPKK